MPTVKITQSLQEDLSQEDLIQLRDEFLAWKAGGEYDHLTFGKDSGFRFPRLAVDEALRHVHLIPIYDTDGLEQWMRAFDRRGRKTSSRVLIYVQGYFDPETYLLIDILEEPDGHDRMNLDHQLIQDLAEIAERFRARF